MRIWLDISLVLQSVGASGQRPIFVCREVRKVVLWVVFIKLTASALELWAAPIPTGVIDCFAGGTVCLVADSAFICPVVASASTTGVDTCRACVCEVAPLPAFHALHWLVFESAWEDPKAADSQAVPNAYVS